jgi:hypothetical protein
MKYNKSKVQQLFPASNYDITIILYINTGTSTVSVPVSKFCEYRCRQCSGAGEAAIISETKTPDFVKTSALMEL